MLKFKELTYASGDIPTDPQSGCARCLQNCHRFRKKRHRLKWVVLALALPVVCVGIVLVVIFTSNTTSGSAAIALRRITTPRHKTTVISKMPIISPSSTSTKRATDQPDQTEGQYTDQTTLMLGRVTTPTHTKISPWTASADETTTTSTVTSLFPTSSKLSTDAAVHTAFSTTTGPITSSATVCKKSEHLCVGSNVCRLLTDLCNGVEDCPGGTDEGSQCLTCGDDEFKCNRSGMCVMKSHICDRFDQCDDASDEWNCANCSGMVCQKSGRCLGLFAKCDGIIQCSEYIPDDYSDELNCSTTGGFQCDNGVTVSQDFVCDGVDNCRDFSDERNCPCTPQEFRCGDDECLPREFTCDGYRDCTDGTDEENCLPCNGGKVLSCQKQVCLEEGQFCDGRSDCIDGEDELDCGELLYGTATEGLVYFRRNGTTHPLCADNVTSSTENLKILCNYLIHGSYISVTDLLANDTAVTFLTFPGNDEGGLRNFISGLNYGACASRKMVKLTCEFSGCGIQTSPRSPKPRVIGGTISPERKWPWVAYITNLGKGICAGSVLNERWILTAAHCFLNLRFSVAYIKVISGTNTPYSRPLDSGTQVLGVRKIVLYQSSQNDTAVLPGRGIVQHDLALVQLDSPLTLGGAVREICIPTDDVTLAENSVCFSAGWGSIEPYVLESGSPDLRHFRTKLRKDSHCQEKWRLTPAQFKGKMCAGFDSGRPSVCSGDSGGPLMCIDSRGFWTLDGVVSFGQYGCPTEGRHVQIQPNVYTKLYNYRRWIEGTISED